MVSKMTIGKAMVEGKAMMSDNRVRMECKCMNMCWEVWIGQQIDIAEGVVAVEMSVDVVGEEGGG